LPKLTYKQLTKRRAQIREHYWQAFWRNSAFVRYRRENLDEVKKFVAALEKTEDARNLHKLARSSYDPEYYVIMGYLKLAEGRDLGTRLGLSPAPRSIVRIATMDGPAGVLTFEIGLAHSVTEIMAALIFKVGPTQGRVLGRHRVSTVSLIPPILRHDLEEREDGKFLIVEIILQHHGKDILKAVKALLPRSRPTGPRQKQKRKVDPWKAWDAVKEYGTFREAARRLGVRESTLKYACHQALDLAPIEVALSAGHCERCPERGSRNCPCPEVEAYANQDKRSLREYLPPNPIIDPIDTDSTDDTDGTE
jgi:hypothetical protein